MRLISFSCITLASLMLLRCQHIAAVPEQKSDSALTVVENVEGEVGAVGDEGEEEVANLKVVQPTEQWQTLKPGEAVPAGSHVRLNLQTGQREVRLGEEQLKHWTQDHRNGGHVPSSFAPDELKQAMKKIKEDLNPDSVASKYRSLEELKKDMAQLDLLVETDVQHST
uniref:Uncharacterized protein n=1 Tax=Scophthalmus maximus TaxID=52904 RepID=A0A8D3CX08_SCOMX